MKIKNAVLWKEMTVDMKKARYIVLITTLVAILSFGAASFVAILGLLAANFNTIPYSTGSVYLTVCIICEAVVLGLIIPIFCAGSITSEREKQTMEILLTTKMSTWEIVKGKFFAPILLTALIVMSLLPILSVGYIYGGLPLWQLLLYTVLLIFWIMYICTFCIYCSAISNRTILSLVLSFVILLLLMAVSIFLVTGACLIIWIFNELVTDFLRNYYPNVYAVTGSIELPITPPIFLLYFNPLVSFYELLVRMFGFSIDGDSFSMAQIISGLSNGKLTDRFIFSRFWLEISVVLQALVGFAVLRAASKVMNPLRNAKKRMKRNEARIAEIEATRDQKRRVAINNGTYQEQMEQVWGPEGAQAAEMNVMQDNAFEGGAFDPAAGGVGAAETGFDPSAGAYGAAAGMNAAAAGMNAAAAGTNAAAAGTNAPGEGAYPFMAQPQAQPQPQMQAQPQPQAQPFRVQQDAPSPLLQKEQAASTLRKEPETPPAPSQAPYPFGTPTPTEAQATESEKEAPYPFSSPKKEDDGYRYPFGQSSGNGDQGENQ